MHVFIRVYINSMCIWLEIKVILRSDTFSQHYINSNLLELNVLELNVINNSN